MDDYVPQLFKMHRNRVTSSPRPRARPLGGGGRSEYQDADGSGREYPTATAIKLHVDAEDLQKLEIIGDLPPPCTG